MDWMRLITAIGIMATIMVAALGWIYLAIQYPGIFILIAVLSVFSACTWAVYDFLE